MVIKLKCSVCPRKCNIDRDIAKGYCGLDSRIKISRAAPHFWEEPCISGSKGSGAVFFTGCSLKCVFCQNYEISHLNNGRTVNTDDLIHVFDNLVNSGVHNINLVTPTHYTAEIYKALKKFNSPIPVVWNSSGYETVDSLKMMEGLVDIYLPDIKFYDSNISLKYSGAENYFEFAAKAVKEMFRQVGNLHINEEGIADKGLIIRHLVLPGNISQTIKIFSYVAENFPKQTAISIMRQYVPCADAASFPPLNRKLTSKEYQIVKKKILELGLENIYFQKAESAEKSFIPQFDYEGIDL